MSDIKGTDQYKWFGDETQKGDLPNFFNIFGFDRDNDGVYHAKQDGWQSWKYVWYNHLYDEAFDLATSMDYQIDDFSAGGEEFRLWLWKGDYLNLGAGAEAGIGVPHWKTGVDYAVPMTLSLKDEKGNEIFDWNPEENNWWCTGFKPSYQNVKAKNLTAEGTIDFSQDQQHRDMFDSFFDEYYGRAPWSFDKNNYKASYKW